jgi:hypothetical protein
MHAYLARQGLLALTIQNVDERASGQGVGRSAREIPAVAHRGLCNQQLRELVV